MKKLIIVLLIGFCVSCAKEYCKKCTRTWTYKKSNDFHEYKGSTETFEACGWQEIENAEKETTRKDSLSGYTITYTSECKCE